MNTLFFWNEWKKTYKLLYLFLLTLFFASLILYIIGYFAGFDFILEWGIKSEFDQIKYSLHQFSQHLFNYSVDVDNYLVKETYFASEIKITPLYSYIWFTLVAIAILICLTILTRLELPWYAIGMIFLIFFIVNLHFELLGVFGKPSYNFTFLAIILYVGSSFYFQAYDKVFSFFQRLLVFIAITIILGCIIAFSSQKENPFFYIANFGIIIPVILTVIFIISVSYELINGFLFLTSSSKRADKNTILHFCLLSILYLTNLFLIFLKKKGLITFDFISIDVFIIYIASAIAGIWGLKKRAFMFKTIIQLSYASFLYISLAIISTTTIAYTFYSGNDALTKTFEYAILYSHLGMGLVFFLYVVYNFWELFYKKLPAYDLVYEPRRMPFFMVRPLGIFITISLLVQSGNYALKVAKGGYYNCLGDIYYYEQDYNQASREYELGAVFGLNTQRGFYSMASALNKLNKREEAVKYYKLLIERNPSDFACINLANIYAESDRYFKALFTLRDGLQALPANGRIHNNLSILYGYKGMWDSTIFHANEAKKYLNNNEVSATNLIWFLGRKNFISEADSILQKNEYPDYISYQNNEIVIANLKGKTLSKKLNPAFYNDSLLTGKAYAYLYNYTTNKIKSPDDEVIRKIDYVLKTDSNTNYYYNLLFLKSLKLYYSGDKNGAIKLLSSISHNVIPESGIYYNKILGLWAMQNEGYSAAAEYFKNATTLLDAETQFNSAIAMLETGNRDEGLSIMEKLQQTPDKEIQLAAKNMMLVYTTKELSEVKNWDNALKYHFLHFRKNDIPEQVLALFPQYFSTEDFKILAQTELIDFFIKKNKPEEAEEIRKQLPQQINNKYIKGIINFYTLRILDTQKNYDLLRKAVNNIYLNEDKENFRPYFIAVSTSGKDAEKYYLEALKQTPFYENAYIRTADFYSQQNKTDKAYEILVEGTQINPNSVGLLKAYALSALKINLTSYADETMLKIKEIDPAAYSGFISTYEAEKAIAEKQFQEF
ncbi:MAG: hypothetical protein K2X86_02990 [Cytophagaceae bacterium]|nr:hypothetical protein [Cytophagaceae bacterium]